MLDATDFADDPDPAILERVPVETAADLVRVLERTEYERRASVKFALMRKDEVTGRRLEAVVKGRGLRHHPVGPEVVEPPEEVLAVQGKAFVLEADVHRPHGVVGQE